MAISAIMTANVDLNQPSNATDQLCWDLTQDLTQILISFISEISASLRGLHTFYTSDIEHMFNIITGTQFEICASLRWHAGKSGTLLKTAIFV